MGKPQDYPIIVVYRSVHYCWYILKSHLLMFWLTSNHKHSVFFAFCGNCWLFFFFLINSRWEAKCSMAVFFSVFVVLGQAFHNICAIKFRIWFTWRVMARYFNSFEFQVFSQEIEKNSRYLICPKWFDVLGKHKVTWKIFCVTDKSSKSAQSSKYKNDKALWLFCWSILLKH